MPKPGLPQPPTHLLYLHGFRSSPQSFKVLRLQGWLAEHQPAVRLWCPQLPASPAGAMALLQEGTRDWPAMRSAVLGSSLGGFYATVWAEAMGWPAVLINPAVDPARDLAAHVGELTLFHTPSERFDFQPGYLDELRAMQPRAITRPERYLAIVAQGDELLDWREAQAFYGAASLRLVAGSDHALSDFDDHLPHLLRFLQLWE